MKLKNLLVVGVFIIGMTFIPNVQAMEIEHDNYGTEIYDAENELLNQRKMQAVHQYMNERQNQPITRGGGNWRGLRNDYPIFKQTRWYYCGPAATKQAIHYITGSSASQETYANYMGTKNDGTGTDQYGIRNTLNHYQSAYQYSVKNTGQLTAYELLYGLRDTIIEDKPAILAVRGQTLYMYNGHENKHYITVIAVYDDYFGIEYSTFTYADTNEADWGRGSTLGIFDEDFMTVYNDVHAIGNHVIW